MRSSARSYQRRSDRTTDPASWISAVAVLASLMAAAGTAGAQTNSPPSPAGDAPAQSAPACASYGAWIDVRTGRSIDREGLFRFLSARRSVVLLGEDHSDADHHLWQMYTVSALHGRGANLVLGFEAFPRRLQGVLNDWVDGKLTEEAFLKATEWQQLWGYDAALYMPLFRFAQVSHIPIVALNVDHALVSQVGQKGWDNVPAAEREGVSDPAPATNAYLRVLAGAYLTTLHSPTDDQLAGHPQALPELDEAGFARAVRSPEFKHFVEAQLTWDRAMAQALAGARQNFANAVVVGIVGSGHVAGGHGVPRQLRALGVYEPSSLIPATVEIACSLIGTGYADAVFTLPRTDETPNRPELGALLEPGDDSPRVTRVANDSVAELAGLKSGDQVLRAAGLEMRRPEDLMDVVARQPPGTWLPLSIRRGDQEIEVIAKFPARAKAN
jgi:uncharacterized iron-regulated protein